MNALTKLKSWRHWDKLLHAVAGLIIYLFAHLWFYSEPALLVVVIVALVKELVYDAERPDRHTKDGWDVVATFVPALLLACLETLL